MRSFSLLVLLLLLSACGSGSQGSAGTDANALQPLPVAGAATLRINTQGASADTVLYGAQFTLRFPPGISLPAATGQGLLPAGVLIPAAGGSYAGANYLDSAAGAGPTLQVNISHPSGFTVGPLAAVNCTVAPGVEYGAGDVTLENFSARDADGAHIPGITATATLQTK